MALRLQSGTQLFNNRVRPRLPAGSAGKDFAGDPIAAPFELPDRVRKGLLTSVPAESSMRDRRDPDRLGRDGRPFRSDSSEAPNALGPDARVVCRAARIGSGRARIALRSGG